MGKLAEIKNENQERAFDLIRETDALYLCVVFVNRKLGQTLIEN